MEDLTEMKISSDINPPLLGKESVARLCEIFGFFLLSFPQNERKIN